MYLFWTFNLKIVWTIDTYLAFANRSLYFVFSPWLKPHLPPSKPFPCLVTQFLTKSKTIPLIFIYVRLQISDSKTQAPGVCVCFWFFFFFVRVKQGASICESPSSSVQSGPRPAGVPQAFGPWGGSFPPSAFPPFFPRVPLPPGRASRLRGAELLSRLRAAPARLSSASGGPGPPKTQPRAVREATGVRRAPDALPAAQGVLFFAVVTGIQRFIRECCVSALLCRGRGEPAAWGEGPGCAVSVHQAHSASHSGSGHNFSISIK